MEEPGTPERPRGNQIPDRALPGLTPAVERKPPQTTGGSPRQQQHRLGSPMRAGLEEAEQERGERGEQTDHDSSHPEQPPGFASQRKATERPGDRAQHRRRYLRAIRFHPLSVYLQRQLLPRGTSRREARESAVGP